MYLKNRKILLVLCLVILLTFIGGKNSQANKEEPTSLRYEEVSKSRIARRRAVQEDLNSRSSSKDSKKTPDEFSFSRFFEEVHNSASRDLETLFHYNEYGRD